MIPNGTGVAIGAMYAFMGKDYFYLSHLVKHIEALGELNKEGQDEDYLRWLRGSSVMFAILAFPILLVCVIAVSILASFLTGNLILGLG